MVKLFVSTFNRKVRWRKCTPIEVGADYRDTFLYDNKDNTGENISNLNPWFGELTGIYWMWKNCQFDDDDIIGFGHWNKILEISQRNVKKIFSYSGGSCWITYTGFTAIPHDFPEDIVALEDVLRDSFPDYLVSWEALYNHDGSSKQINNCYSGQLWYTTVNEFNKYCEFIFPLLFTLFDVHGKVDREAYHKRYIAFVGERLLSVYLHYNNIVPKKKVDILFKNNGKIMRGLKRVLPIRKDSKFYQYLSKRWGGSSSYR